MSSTATVYVNKTTTCGDSIECETRKLSVAARFTGVESIIFDIAPTNFLLTNSTCVMWMFRSTLCDWTSNNVSLNIGKSSFLLERGDGGSATDSLLNVNDANVEVHEHNIVGMSHVEHLNLPSPLRLNFDRPVVLSYKYLQHQPQQP